LTGLGGTLSGSARRALHIQRLLPEVEKMMDTGLIATSDIDAIRVVKRS